MTDEYENIRVVQLEENPKDLCIDALLSTGELVQITREMQESRPMASHWASFKEKTGTALTYTPVTPFERAEHILGLRNSRAALHPWEVELAKRINQPKEGNP